MKKIMAIIAFGGLLLLGIVAQAADQPQGSDPHAGHQMPTQGGQGSAEQPQTDPHAGYQMPSQGGQGMMGGQMHQMMMNCPMRAQSGKLLALMKDIVVTQEALLKGVSGAERDALQVKLADMRKAIDGLQAEPMGCPMMRQMQHGQKPAGSAGNSGGTGGSTQGK